MSRIGRALAHRAVRAYPHAWRVRYEPELHALVEDRDAGLADAIDLTAGAMRRHLNGGAPMRFEPAHRHPLAFAVLALVVMAPTLVFISLSAAGLDAMTWITGPRIVDLGLVLAPLASVLLAALPLVDARVERGIDGPVLGLRVRALPANLVVSLVAMVLSAFLIGHIVTESVLHLGA